MAVRLIKTTLDRSHERRASLGSIRGPELLRPRVKPSSNALGLKSGTLVAPGLRHVRAVQLPLDNHHGRLCDPGNDEAVSSLYFLSAFASYAQHVNSPVVCLRIEDFE
jgi:hypothetical protein